jgi:hypothetical protein
MRSRKRGGQASSSRRGCDTLDWRRLDAIIARASIIRIRQLNHHSPFDSAALPDANVTRRDSGTEVGTPIRTLLVYPSRAYRRHVLDSSLDSSIAISERSVHDRQ